jgi:predicted nucleic acid-binding Zn finger protein
MTNSYQYYYIVYNNKKHSQKKIFSLVEKCEFLIQLGFFTCQKMNVQLLHPGKQLFVA